MSTVSTRPGGVCLSRVLPECISLCSREIHVTSCCSDARDCRPGDLYVALVHDDYDGHDFASHAVANGATAVLAERPLPVNVPVCLVPDTRVAYGQLCQALVGDPTAHMCTLGVTGTNGKTVTSTLLAAVLRAAGQRVGTINSLQCSDGFGEIPRGMPTAPPEMARSLAEMQACGCTHAVVELSSRDLARRRPAGIQLDAAIMTNLRRAALDLHGNATNYRRSKLRLFDHLKPGGFAVLNADDQRTAKALPNFRFPSITVATQADAEITATLVERQLAEQTFLLSAGDEMIPVRTRMIGDHHVYNCLLAAATGLVLGIDLPTIVRGLESVESVSRRMERIECGQPFGVFVDVANSADRMAVCLKTLRRLTRGRLIVVASVDGRRSPSERPMLGRLVEKNASLAVIATRNTVSENALGVVHDVLDGYDRPARAHVMPDHQQAITWALSQAGPGDCVLIAGCDDTHSPTTVTAAAPGDDREIAQQWLYQTLPYS